MSVAKRNLHDVWRLEAARNFARDSAEHVVQQCHRDGDVVKLWRCGRPQSSVFMFYVCSAPHCLMTYGDMGECMWCRDPEMIPFVRGSIDSVGYFAEKVPASIVIREYKKELVTEWLDTVKDEWIEQGSGWSDEQEQALSGLRDEWSWHEDFDGFRRAIWESELYVDSECMPDLRGFTYRYLWICEGLKWFVGKLDAGEVLPPNPEVGA